ncbi:MAG: response regulator [Deltaproteobacteria bacterium]|jgi:DNA-binding response OmpR family regulator
MSQRKILEGKFVLIVDDEQDILDLLINLLDMCRIDAASSFEQAKELLESNEYDIAILDIMGVKGYELLRIANEYNIPALMLTAHALTKEDLRKSAEEGASYYVPKDMINEIDTFVADVLEAKEKYKNPWVRWFERLGSFFDKKFSGTNWREQEKEFWSRKLDV